METLHAKYYPFIFKIGMTQNAANRWDSPRSGYKFERDKWESMLVIFLGPEKFTPAMLEAALIDKYRSLGECICKLCPQERAQERLIKV